jgi:hypothetical protein
VSAFQNSADMKLNKTTRLIAIILAILPVGFSACIKDKCKSTHTYTWYEPVYKSKAEVRANIKSNAPQTLKNTGKLYIYGNYIFLNEVDKGIHVINNSNPSSPRNIAFIDIPGNMDIAIKDNMLYADLYSDLVTIDVSNPANVSVKKIIDGVFPERLYGYNFYPDPNKVIVDWIRHDSTVTESCDNSAPPPIIRGGPVFLASAGVNNQSVSPVGLGGSMARFTIVNNYMYAVDRHTLHIISVSNAADPTFSSNMSAGWDIETIYPFRNKLFIGSMGGMFIYDISNPASPVSQGAFVHARACDPVIADDNYAYVTLQKGTRCGPANNALDIVNIQNLQSPSLVKTYSMSGPRGLSKDNNLLFICDGKDGLKVYNAFNVQNLQLVKRISGIETYDVITYNHRAMVVAKDGLYQYDYTDINNIRLLSKITVNK